MLSKQNIILFLHKDNYKNKTNKTMFLHKINRDSKDS